MGKNKREYDKYIAVKVFFVTFILALFVGIPVPFIIKGFISGNNSQNGQDAVANAYAGGWEVIPEAAAVTGITVSVEENPTEESFYIPDEDEAYTHIIETADEECVTIGFAGDILFDDNYAVGNAFKNHGNSAEGVIGESLLSRMRASDIMVINNEFPYSNGGSPTEGKTFTFRARPETAQILGTMGVDLAALANNHAYDYGQQALVDSFSALRDAGIEYMGAGNNIEEASHPIYYITQSGIKIAIINATQIERLDNPDTKGATENSPGVFRCLDDSLLLERIRQAREKNAFVIVFIHWGTESTTEIDWLQRDQSKEIAQAGANLIIGAHPHILQKIDYVGDTPVVYSLGNYIFNSKTLDTCMVEATIHKDGALNLKFIPAIQANCTVKEASGEEASRILSEMRQMSPGITIDSSGYISH